MTLDSEEAKQIYQEAKRIAELRLKGTRFMRYFIKYAVDMDRAMEDLKRDY